jgi:hypothetical protein
MRVSGSGEPVMCLVVLDMGGVHQRDQNIHVQQERSHGRSSRSWFTSSRVTGAAS